MSGPEEGRAGPAQYPLSRRAAVLSAVGVALAAAAVVFTVGVSTLPSLPPLTETSEPGLTGYLAYQTWQEQVCVEVVEASTGAARQLVCEEEGLEYRWSETGSVEVVTFGVGFDDGGPGDEGRVEVTAYRPDDGTVVDSYQVTEWLPYGWEDAAAQDQRSAASPDGRWTYQFDEGDRLVVSDPQADARAWVVTTGSELASWHMADVGTTYLP